MAAPRIHLLILTHTTRHLDLALAALALQTSPPDSVCVSTDTDDPAITALIDRLWSRVAARLARETRPAPPLRHVARTHTGQARLNQVRNNGLRAIGETANVAPSDLVVILDGDTMLAEDAVARYRAFAAAGVELVIPFRINLDQRATARLSRDLLLSPDPTAPPPLMHLASAGEYEALETRDLRYRRQLRQRRGPLGRAGLVKNHKPKVLGGHHAVSWRAFQEINGYDERYTGWGFDDDELTRRLHMMRPAPKTEIAVSRILAFHLWHESRAPRRLSESPGHALFKARPHPRIAVNGLTNPVEQAEPTVRVVSPKPALDHDHDHAVEPVKQ